MNAVASVCVLAIVACIASAACVQSAHEGARGARSVAPSPYADKDDEYIAEREALRGGRGERLSGTLRLRLANGRTVHLVDKIEDSGEYRRYVYDRYMSEGKLHVVTIHLYE